MDLNAQDELGHISLLRFVQEPHFFDVLNEKKKNGNGISSTNIKQILEFLSSISNLVKVIEDIRKFHVILIKIHSYIIRK